MPAPVAAAALGSAAKTLAMHYAVKKGRQAVKYVKGKMPQKLLKAAVKIKKISRHPVAKFAKNVGSQILKSKK